MNSTRFLSRALLFPFLVAFTGEDDLGGPILQSSSDSEMQTSQDPELDESDLDEDTSESSTESDIECILISHIRIANFSTMLRRIPVGFHVTVKTETETKRTSNKPASVSRDMIEWDDGVALPLDGLSKISLTVSASFELGPLLGSGEVLCVFEAPVGDLLDHQRQRQLIRPAGRSDEGDPPHFSCEIEVERRVYDQNHHMLAPDVQDPEVLRRLGKLTDLGHHALVRYREHQEQRDLDESIKYFEEALNQRAPSEFILYDLTISVILFNLATAKLVRYRVNDVFADLDTSIDLYRDVLRLLRPGHLDLPSTLLSLGIALEARFQRQQDEADWTEGRSLLLRVLDIAPTDSYSFHAAVLALGSAATSEMIQSREILNTINNDEEIQRLDAVLQRIFHANSRKHMLLDHLGILFCVRSLRFTPEGHSKNLLRLNNLGYSLLTRYDRLGDVADLKRSIFLFEDIVQFTSDEHPDKPTWLSNLGSSLLTRFQRFGDVSDLKRSISLKEDALRLTPDGHPDKQLRLNNLGSSVLSHYLHFGDVTDLEKSISLVKDAVDLIPDGHEDKPSRLNSLGDSLLIRYLRFGDVTDLERSIALFKDVIKFAPDKHPNKLLWLNNLGNSLYIRFRHLGDVTDLERSISLFEDVVKSTPGGHPDKPKRLNNLGKSLASRYRRLGDFADLERSITLFEDAVLLTPDGHHYKPSWLNNLGGSLSTRYKRLGDITDLKRSISLREDAARLTPDGHSWKPLLIDSLGRLFWASYKRTRDIVSLEKSISLFHVAMQSTPDGHLNQALQLKNLAASLLERFQHSGDLSSPDLSQAILYSSRAARSHTGLTVDRFKASQIWIQSVRLLQHDFQSLLDAYTTAVELLPQLAWLGLSLHDRYHQLLRATDGARDAAAAALDFHEPTLAVEWLEQGRSIVWSQLSQLRTPVDDLRVIHPELAARFEQVSRALEHASDRDGQGVDNKFDVRSDMQAGVLEAEARQHHTLALSRESLLAEIRALPGFERFLLPKTITQLSSLAHSGPVIFLNASKYRCDALVVVANSEHVIHVPLLKVNYNEIEGMQLRLNNLLKLKGRVSLRDAQDRGARFRDMTPEDVFRPILTHLWEKVVDPILEVLHLPPQTSNGKLPRIFWCPTGPFSFLPIHAAGIYTATNPGPKLSDFAISSFIPTMSVLELPSQKESEMTLGNIRLLAVPQPSTDGQSHLGGVRGEIETIKRLASLSPFVGFQEADGTVEDVLSKMTETDWVHFACHGTQDRTNPYDSGFLLANGKRLKLPDIARLSRPRGGLAFLSACYTATGDQQLSEEAIHIAGGMLLAGYGGVIATLWSIMDNDAPRVTEEVYKSLFSDGQVPDSRYAAEALHHAVGRLRDSGAPFLHWVPFIHVGL